MPAPFLNPWALTGLAAVGLPVLIHLLNRHRAVTIQWGAMVLLRKIMTFRSRQIRLEDLLLMLLRCLVILLVVLAAARPTTRWLPVRKPDVGIVVALDASMSMAHRPGLESRFDHAVSRIREIMKTVEPGAPVTLALLGNNPRILFRNTGYDPKRFDEALRDASPFDEALNPDRCMPELATLLENIKAPERELYIVTDGQATTWRNLSSSTREAFSKIRRAGRAFLVAADSPSSQNLAVTQLELASGLLRVGSLVRYQAGVRNFGPDPQDNVEASLSLDDQVADKRFVGRLQPGESVSVPLYAQLTHEGILRVSARVSDDPLPEDNAAFAVAQVRRTIRVLCVDGDPSDKQHGGATAYIMAALAPHDLDRPDSDVEAVTIPWLNLVTAHLRDYDAVILADVPELPRESVVSLQGFVEQGGGLMLFLGRNTKPESLNRDFGHGATPLLPGELAPGVSDFTGARDGTPVDWSSLDHSVVRPLRSLPVDLLSESRVYKLVKARPLPDARVVLKLANGSPLLIEKNCVRGKVLLFTSSADATWNNMVVNPAYPIMLNQAVMFLLRQSYEQPVTIPQPLTLPLPGIQPGTAVTITDPSGAVREVRTVQRNGQTLAESPGTSKPGFYTVRAGKDSQAVPVAVNIAPGESDVKVLDVPTLAAGTADCGAKVLAPGENISAAVNESRVGRELWPALAILAAILLVLEGIVARRYTRSGEERKSARAMLEKFGKFLSFR